MDSREQFESPQQTRLSGFFRNVHSKFLGLSKKDPPKVEDVVITSQVLRKKPQLVIGNVSNIIPSPPAVDDSNGNSFIQTGAGAGTKRKATIELEDVMHKRIDARIREEVSIPTCYSNDFANLKPALKQEKEVEKPKAFSVKQVTWEQDSDWIAMNEPTVSYSHEESKKSAAASVVPEDVIAQKSHNSGSTILLLSDNNSLQDDPPCQWKVGTSVAKNNNNYNNYNNNNNKEEFFNSFADEIDSEDCTNRQKKDECLGEKWSLPVDLKGDVFSCKLKEILAKPFDDEEMTDMWNMATRRKPVLKLRQTRGRTMQVTTKDEGLSYLDHHPDLTRRLEDSEYPAEKLALLRSFFFWLQHSCMEGAFKPWAPATKNSREEDDDCDFTDGPDCEILAVVLPLDEKKDVSSFVKPIEPITVDLSDSDEDDCLEVSVKLPCKAAPKLNNCNNVQKAPTCNCCLEEFGMEKDNQRALYKACGHIETCMKCVDRLWMCGKHTCLKCGAVQSVRPRSIMDFADDSD